MKRVLIEAFKLTEGKRDGCFRYTLELLKGLIRLNREQPFEFQLEALVGGTALPIRDVAHVLDGSLKTYEKKEQGSTRWREFGRNSPTRSHPKPPS